MICVRSRACDAGGCVARAFFGHLLAQQSGKQKQEELGSQERRGTKFSDAKSTADGRICAHDMPRVKEFIAGRC